MPNANNLTGSVPSSDKNPTNHETGSLKLDEEAGAVEEILLKTDGYEHDLKQNFGFWSVLGLTCGLTASWSAIASSLITGFQSGGPMMIIYGLIIMAVVAMCIVITLAELVSAYPENSGGQYYWTFQLAPKKYKRFWAYMCGYMGWFGAVFSSSSIIVSCAQGTVGSWALANDQEPKTWQIFVAYQLSNLLIAFFNIYERPLPHINTFILYFTIISFLIIILVVTICAKGHYADASFVFVDFNNGTGWNSATIAFLVGLINPAYSYSCLDAATHMAEEIHHPELVLPKAMIWTIIIGFVTAFLYSIAVFFCITDLEAIYNSATGLPMLDIFYQAVRNKNLALFLEALVTLTSVGALISSHTWQARLSWSFSRDEGIWGSKYWSKVNHKTNLPINAHIMSCFWNAIIGCIYMASNTAFGAIVTASITFLQLSYCVPVVALLYKGRNNFKHGPFWLGWVGAFCNYVTVGFAIFALIFFSFPSEMPVAADTMNYSSVVIVGLLTYVVAYWFIRGHKRFAKEHMAKDEIEEIQLAVIDTYKQD